VLASWDRLRAKASANPAGGMFGGVELDQFTIGGLYTDRGWPTLSAALTAYDAGDSGPLIASKHPATAEDVNFESVFQTVSCADAPFPADETTFALDMIRLKARYGAIGAAIAAPGSCLYLQTNTQPPTPIDGAGLPGVLLIQSEGDPATPYVGALRMHEALPSSRLLTVRANGNHGHFLVDGPCVEDRTVAYLVDGSLPENDITCDGAAPPTPKTRRFEAPPPHR
jgi:TAP-like protein